MRIAQTGKVWINLMKCSTFSAFKWQEYADQQRKSITPQLGIDNRPAGDAPNYTTHPGAKLGGMALHGVEVEFRKKVCFFSMYLLEPALFSKFKVSAP